MSQGEEGIDRVRSSTTGMKAARHVADEEARKAIARVEASLSEALEGETLRGLPELGGRVFGLRVGVEGSMFARLPRNRRVFIVDNRGRLMCATLFPEGVFVEKPDDREVVASTLVPYLSTVQRGMTLHMESATKRTEQFTRIASLANKISTVLG